METVAGMTGLSSRDPTFVLHAPHACMLDWTVSSHDTIGPAFRPCFSMLLVRNGRTVLPSLRAFRRMLWMVFELSYGVKECRSGFQASARIHITCPQYRQAHMQGHSGRKVLRHFYFIIS
jgi:hypothetical protein